MAIAISFSYVIPVYATIFHPNPLIAHSARSAIFVGNHCMLSRDVVNALDFRSLHMQIVC